MSKQDSASIGISAVSRVFAIPEIAEIIFLHLTLSELLTVAQQVCKQWNHTILASTALQELLFLRPVFVNALCYNGVKGTRNNYGADMTSPVIENPFAILLSHPEPPSKLSRPAASWRRMLLTQPPVNVAHFCTKEDWSDLIAVSRFPGLLMGDFTTPVYGIIGSSKWLAFESHRQLRAIKDVSKSPLRYEEDTTWEDDGLEWEDWIAENHWMCCSSWNAYC